MIQYLYSEKAWKLRKPKLLLSICGSSNNFRLSHEMKVVLKEALVRVATSTGG
jgi:hypothetical protein